MNLICISTYKKWDACQALLDSLIKFGYTKDSYILICDDNNNEPDKLGLNGTDILKKYKKQIKDIALAYGPRSGVAKNKNRGIKFFLENKKFDSLILCDDDLELVQSGLIERLRSISEKDEEHHITLKWTDGSKELKEGQISSTLLGLKGNGWDKDFPVIAETDDLTFHLGCQGIFLWFNKRELVESIGYFPLFQYIYGGEHTVYSAQAMLAQGKSPELYPQMKRSYRYVLGQAIPNDYSIDMEKVKQNLIKHNNLVHKIKMREYMHNPYNGLNKKAERLIK